jgi:hypothetical protein
MASTSSITEALQIPRRVESRLYYCRLSGRLVDETPEPVEFVREYISRNSRNPIIDLNQRNIGSQCAEVIADAIRTHLKTKIPKTIILYGNRLNIRSILTIFRPLEENPSITTVDIRYNLTRNDVIRLSRELEELPTLRCAVLQYPEDGWSGIMTLGSPKKVKTGTPIVIGRIRVLC